MTAAVGFLRAIKLAWLNKTVELVLEDKSTEQIRNDLDEYLSYEIKSATTLRKTREILMNTWVAGKTYTSEIRQAALNAYKSENSNRVALHYCMLILAYPVVADICGLIGKLSTIQDTFTTTWLKEKIYEVWGERVTVANSLKYILQSLKDFCVIESNKTGTHHISRSVISDSDTIRVILMTVLRLNGKAYYEITELSRVPQMFPFEYCVSFECLHNSPDYTLNNFGGKMVLTTSSI